MERSNPPPKTECCREQGQVAEATEASEPNDLLEAYTGKLTGRKQDSHPAKAIQPRDGINTQAGTTFPNSEPNTSQSARGEGQLGLPGSESVACEQRTARNLGHPVDSRRSPNENQAGKRTQRQEATTEGELEIRLTHTSSEQPRTEEADASEGVNMTSQPAKETGAVRTTEQHWPTSLRAIARKAPQDKRHRFGGLYLHLVLSSKVRCRFDGSQRSLKQPSTRCFDDSTARHVRKRDVMKSPVRENCTPGSVRGAPGNGCPYLALSRRFSAPSQANGIEKSVALNFQSAGHREYSEL